MSTLIKDNIVYGPDYPVEDPTLGFRSLGEFCQVRLKQQDDLALLTHGITGEIVTARQMLSRSNRLAFALSALGIKTGDKIGMFCFNEIEFYYVMLATFYLGATLVPIFPKQDETVLHHVLSMSKPPTIFTTLEHELELRKAAESLDFIKNIFIYGKDFGKQSNGTNCTVDDDEMFPTETKDIANTIAAVLQSSGTTGMPKGVELTQLNAFASFHVYYMDPSEYYIIWTPLGHISSFRFALKWMTSIGQKTIIIPIYQDNEFLRNIAKYKIKSIFISPPKMEMFAKSPIVEQYDLSSLTCIIYASGRFDYDTVQWVRKRLNIDKMRQQYSMTETMGIIVEPDSGVLTPNSIGKLREGVRAKVVDLKTGQTLSPNQHGEMLFKSIYNMKGYCNNAAATQEVFDEQGFMRSGDIGYYDENGEWFYIDRIKGIIRYYTHIILPAELEAALLLHPQIRECCVVALKNEVTYEMPYAYIVKSGDLCENDVYDHLAKQLCVPKRLYGGLKFVGHLPKTVMGKTMRFQLDQSPGIQVDKAQR